MAIDGAVTHVGDAGEHALLVARDDKNAALVGHAAGDEGGVARREQGDVGIGQGLACLIEDGTLVARGGLLRALDGDFFALHGHLDGIKADQLLDGIGYRLVLDSSRHPEVLQLVVEETDIVFPTPLVEPLERLTHRHVIECPRHPLPKGCRDDAKACHEKNHTPCHHSTTIVLPSLLIFTLSNRLRRSSTASRSSSGCQTK